MLTADELRRISDCASDVIAGISEATLAADSMATGDRDFYSSEFITQLYAIEEAYERLNAAMPIEAKELFASLNNQPVQVGRVPTSSIHEAAMYLGLDVRGITYDLMESEFPGYHQPGHEYICQELPCRQDILKHIDVAVRSFREQYKLSIDDLNNAMALVRQELARAVLSLPPERREPTGINGEITLADMASLIGLEKQTLNNNAGKPAPVRKGSGRQAAAYDYQALRAWIADTFPNRTNTLPTTFAEARLRLQSVQSGNGMG